MSELVNLSIRVLRVHVLPHPRIAWGGLCDWKGERVVVFGVEHFPDSVHGPARVMNHGSFVSKDENVPAPIGYRRVNAIWSYQYSVSRPIIGYKQKGEPLVCCEVPWLIGYVGTGLDAGMWWYNTIVLAGFSFSRYSTTM